MAACWPRGSSPADLIASSRSFTAAVKSEVFRLFLASERYFSAGLVGGPPEHAPRGRGKEIGKKRKKQWRIGVTPALKRGTEVWGGTAGGTKPHQKRGAKGAGRSEGSSGS